MGGCYVTPLMQFEVSLSLSLSFFYFFSSCFLRTGHCAALLSGKWKEREVLKWKSVSTFLLVINSVAEEIELRNKCRFGVPDRFK